MAFLSRIYVSSGGFGSHKGRLALGGRSIDCSLGPSGIVRRKHEGDAATPAGIWPLRCVYYRADRVERPRTGLPVYPIEPDQGWCDAPGDRFYNRPVQRPYPASNEALSREDHLYDLLVVLGHNDAPVVPGRGSCIFFHLKREDGGPTAGCVAVTQRDMRTILKACGPQTAMVVR